MVVLISTSSSLGSRRRDHVVVISPSSSVRPHLYVLISTLRLMKRYKEYVLNKRYIEGSITEAYVIDESVIYCMEYMPNSRTFGHKSSREDWLDESVDFTHEMPLEIGGVVELNHVQFEQVRRWVLNRLADFSECEEKYNRYYQCISIQNRKGGSIKENTTIKEFIPWLCDELLDAGQTNTTLWRLANGPQHRATQFNIYRVNGFVFAPSSSDECLVTQDSGVSMEAYSNFVSSRKDKNPKGGMMTFYGIVRNILELDYLDSKNGCKSDTIWKKVMVNLKKLRNKERVEEDPFILAQEATIVFYSKDQKTDGWYVVINTPKMLNKQFDAVDIPTDYQSCLNDNPNIRNLVMFDD